MKKGMIFTIVVAVAMAMIVLPAVNAQAADCNGDKKPATATIASTAIGAALGSLIRGPHHTAAMIIGGALGYLLGDRIDDARAAEDAQRAVKTTSWYRDSSGRQEWSERGQQTQIGEPVPDWVGK